MAGVAESDSWEEKVPSANTTADPGTDANSADGSEDYASPNEYIFVRNRQSTQKELMELKDTKAVKKSLKSNRNWAILAASISVKHSRIHSHYVGWEGLRSEKDSDHGKVRRIQVDQKEELKSLRKMGLVQRMLREDKDISAKTTLLFSLPHEDHNKKNNIIISNPAQSRKRDKLKKSVRATSLAMVGKIFSAPSKSRRVLDRLTAKQLQDIGNAEVKRRQQIQPHTARNLTETHPLLKPNLQRGRVVRSTSDENSDDDTLDPSSDKEFGSTSTLAGGEKPFFKKRSLHVPTTSPLLLEHSSTISPTIVTAISNTSPIELSSLEESRIQTDGISRSLSNETSSGSDCYSSQTSTSYSNTQSTQSSFEWELAIEEDEDEEKRGGENRICDSVAFSCQKKSTVNIKVPQSIPSIQDPSFELISNSQISFQYSSTDSDTSPVHEKPRPSLSDSWDWLDFATTDEQFLTRSNSELSAMESSYNFFRQSVVSPGLSDTPLDLLDNHPLSVDPETGATCNSTNISNDNNKCKLPDEVFEDPKFIEYCRRLDHPPTREDYTTYKILIVSELIDAKFGNKLEAALHEVMLIALKDKLGYAEFAKISYKLALQAKHIQERMLLISCLGRRLLEKMPNLEDMISSYTTYAVEEMALVGLDWSGDNPYHNPEIRWDYDDWKYSNARDALEENYLTYQTTSDSEDDNPYKYGNTLTIPTVPNGIRRSSSVEVLTESNDDNNLTPPPVHILWRRRCSWGNAYVPPQKPSPPLPSLPSYDDNNTLSRNDSIMTVTTADEVSLHLGTFRNHPNSSKPIVFSLSSQSSVDSVASSFGVPSIRKIRGRQLSSASSSGGSTNTSDRMMLEDPSDPLTNITQPIVELEENEEENNMYTGSEHLLGENQNESTCNNGRDQDGGGDHISSSPVDNLQELRRSSKGSDGQEEEVFEEEGKGVPTTRRKSSTAQIITEAVTSPVVTIGLSIAIVAAALTIGKS